MDWTLFNLLTNRKKVSLNNLDNLPLHIGLEGLEGINDAVYIDQC